MFFLTRQFKRENLVGQQENVKADVSASFSVSSSYSFFAVFFQLVPGTVSFSVSCRYSFYRRSVFNGAYVTVLT